MEIKEIKTYHVDDKTFSSPEEAEAYLLNKVQAELNEKLKPVFSKYYNSASLNYYLILNLVGTAEDLKETLKILSIYSEFERPEEFEEDF